jgi:hypothetical protein
VLLVVSRYEFPETGGGMHSWTAIRFYEINTPLTEAVLPDGRNNKTICLCVISYYEEKWRK